MEDADFEVYNFDEIIETGKVNDVDFIELDEATMKDVFEEAFLDSEKTVEKLVDEFDEYGEVAAAAFRVAVENDNINYVLNHYEDVDMNNDEGVCCFYDDAFSDEMKDTLVECGGFRPEDEYSDFCVFAYATYSDDIIAWDDDFQKHVIEKIIEENGTTLEALAEKLNDDEEEPDDETEGLVEELKTMGVTFEDGEYEIDNNEYSLSGCGVAELLENYGYSLDFEGDSWKFETIGFYFIRKDSLDENYEEKKGE